MLQPCWNIDRRPCIYRMVLMAHCYISTQVQSFKVMSIKLAKSFCQVPSVTNDADDQSVRSFKIWRGASEPWVDIQTFDTNPRLWHLPNLVRPGEVWGSSDGWWRHFSWLIIQTCLNSTQNIYIYRSSCGMPFAIYYGWIFIQIIPSISYQALSNLQSLSKHDRLERVDNI